MNPYEKVVRAMNKGDKLLCHTPYLDLLVRDGWYYFACIPGSMGGVSMLLYRLGDGKNVLGRYEKTPPHADGLALTAISGGIEKGDNPLQTCIKEAREEAGYGISRQKIVNLGTCMLSTNQDTRVWLYACDVTGLPRYEAIPDGTRGEEDAYCEWVTAKEAIMSKSAMMGALMSRFYVVTGIRLF